MSLVVVKKPLANEIERCNQKSFLGTYKVIVIRYRNTYNDLGTVLTHYCSVCFSANIIDSVVTLLAV